VHTNHWRTLTDSGFVLMNDHCLAIDKFIYLTWTRLDAFIASGALFPVNCNLPHTDIDFRAELWVHHSHSMVLGGLEEIS